MNQVAFSLAMLIAVTGSSCRSDQPPGRGDRPEAVALAMVNGVPITEVDLQLESRSPHAEATVAPEQRKTMLESLIRNELLAQRASALGLDNDSSYREQLRRMEAQIRAFKRRTLIDALFKREIAAKAKVSDEEVKRYFDQNTDLLQTELHLFQIFVRDPAKIEQALAELRAGKPFEEVAKQQFPNLPSSGPMPWDVGYLKWSQVPEPWRATAHALKSGETSDIISGPKNRFWIIKMIDKRVNKALAFEDIKAGLVEHLRSKKIEELNTKLEEDVRKNARVTYVDRAKQ